MSRGLFLSLDGLDGAGKSTQCQLLAHWLRNAGRRVTLCRDPGGTLIGDRIRELLLDRKSEMTLACEAFLYMASRAQLVTEVIQPALQRGEVVVSDRFLLANVVYQGHAGGLAVDELWAMGRLATGGLEPALTLVLDLPPAAAFARKEGPSDRVESRGVDFFSKVRAGFLAEAKRSPDTIRIIDATAPVDAVQQAIQQEVSRVLGTHSRP